MQSIVNDVINWCTHVIAVFGLPGVFVLMFLESACIPIPAETTMMFAGFAVSQGKMGLAAAIVAGVAGNVVGAWVVYYIGLYGGRPFIDRYGKYVLLKHEHIELTERWFAKYGAVAVFFCRMIPGVRSFVSLPAGVARMPLWKFTMYTALGCIPFVAVLTWLGVKLGANWESIQQQFKWLDYAVFAVIVAIVVWVVVRRLRRRPA
ncbi:MAG TPA: DedA family protein [Thermoleophilia bacterium]|nr:DedA family protein [Thermoleophilia bacterium]